MNRMRDEKVKNLVISAICLALALVLPFLTGQIPEIGKMLSPMHIPVLLCGFICGPGWGLAVGLVAPLMRSLLFGMPVLFPNAIGMMADWAVRRSAGSCSSPGPSRTRCRGSSCISC